MQAWQFRPEPFTQQDVIGIQVEKFATDNTIEYTTVLNYTDSLQTLHRSCADSGLCAGLLVHNCFFGYTSDVYTNGGKESILGCEQPGFDFKVGGTVAKPIVVKRNTIFGGRPNTSSIGDAISPHFVDDNIQFIENVFSDCECLVTLNVVYGPPVTFTGGGGQDATGYSILDGGQISSVIMPAGYQGTGYSTPPTPVFAGGGTGATGTAIISNGKVTGVTVTNGGSGYATVPPNHLFQGNLITGMKSHGSGVWPGREGHIRQLSNTMQFIGNNIVDCDIWADRDTGAYEESVQASTTEGNTVYGTIQFGFQFADSAAWLAASNYITSDSVVVQKTVGIPFTQRTITYKGLP